MTGAAHEPERPPILGPRFEDALVYAAQLHRNQVRKGSGVPYVSHLLGVASLVLEDGGSEDEGIAGLLHDAAEDQGGEPRLAEIKGRFGADVARIVRACSDAFETPKPPWRQRKERYLKHLEGATPDELRVSLADKLHNARAILADHREIGERVWTRFKPDADSLWYYRRVAELFTRRLPGRMAGELEIVVAEIERRTAAARPPIPDSYWVQPGRLIAGEYPGAKAGAPAKVTRLVEAGVTLFLDLTEDRDGLTAYRDHVAPRARHVRLGVRDLGVPTPEDMRRILDTIDAAIAQDETVYVHCWGGVGRTGTVVGCWLVRHGVNGDEALARVEALRATTPKASRPSPENNTQRDLVRSWASHDGRQGAHG